MVAVLDTPQHLHSSLPAIPTTLPQSSPHKPPVISCNQFRFTRLHCRSLFSFALPEFHHCQYFLFLRDFFVFSLHKHFCVFHTDMTLLIHIIPASFAKSFFIQQWYLFNSIWAKSGYFYNLTWWSSLNYSEYKFTSFFHSFSLKILFCYNQLRLHKPPQGLLGVVPYLFLHTYNVLAR